MEFKTPAPMRARSRAMHCPGLKVSGVRRQVQEFNQDLGSGHSALPCSSASLNTSLRAQDTRRPVRQVRVVGHTDPVGLVRLQSQRWGSPALPAG